MNSKEHSGKVPGAGQSKGVIGAGYRLILMVTRLQEIGATWEAEISCGS